MEIFEKLKARFLKMMVPENSQTQPGEIQSLASQMLVHLCDGNAQHCLTALHSRFEGLSAEEVEFRLEQYGLNEIAQDKIPSWYFQLFKSFITPFNGILIFLGTISLITDIIFASVENRSWRTIIMISIMIALSTLLRFWQEYKSIVAAEKLKAMVKTTATVVRKDFSEPKEVSTSHLVPGDIIKLSAGDMIPADVRLLISKDLFVNQAVLTGESLPVEKHSQLKHHLHKDSLNPFELSSICLMGTDVVSGTATAVIVNTGNHTYFGSLAKKIVNQRPLTSFDIGINKVSWIIIRLILVMVPIVFLLNGITKEEWLNSLLFAVSVAVGLTPEMLPMIVTANLAKGAVAMSRRKTIVKSLNSIQNFGAMNILCTDKTGTLTQNKIVVVWHLDVYGHKHDQSVLKYAYLNSHYQTGLKNLLDLAIIDYIKEHKHEDLKNVYERIDEIPFDFSRRRMSIVLKENETTHLLICKGAVEEVMALCTHFEEQGVAKLLSDDVRKKAKHMVEELATDGLRVLAVAYKSMPASAEYQYTFEDETKMTLAGYVAFLDPPKATAKEAIIALQHKGIIVKVITGDNEMVTQKICKEVGLMNGHNIVLGNNIDTMTDTELADIAENTTVFAKISPLQKSRIIRALKMKNNTVGYIGDGINDAAALREADVGISVDTAVDIAKESADIILLDKSLMVIDDGVLEGRKTFGNIIKYIKMTASSNFGNVFSVLTASAFLPFLPMLPIHLLIQNLLYDISQTVIPWDNVDREYLKVPRKWDASGIARFMMFIGPISSIFDIITFIVMWNVFKANSVLHQSLFQSGWFIVGLLTQTLIVHMIRTPKIPFIQSMASTPVILLTMIIMMIGIYIPYSILGEHVKFVPLPAEYFVWLVGILTAYCTLTQFVKVWYIRRFHEWL